MDSAQQECTVQAPNFAVQPTTSLSSDRYDKRIIVAPNPTTVPPGLFHSNQGSEPLYLPSNWSAYVHPEGQLYFYRDSKPRIVTEAYLYRQEIMETISYAIKWLEDHIAQRNISLSDDVELYLRLDEPSGACSYYLIDHASRTQFWIDPMPTELLDLPPVVSTSHLKLALEEHYWNHVENFPMHFGGLKVEAIDELINVFSHGRADRMTSKVSTFPYNAEECANFLHLLGKSRGNIANGHITCFVARLWYFIVSNRFSAHYGQEHARLSRDQTILVPINSRKSWLFIPAFKLSFGVCDFYLSQFNKLFVDDLVYQDQWRLFITKSQDDWKLSLSWAFPLLMSNIIMASVSTTLSALTIATSLISLTCILAGMLLLINHQEHSDCTTSFAANYLQRVRSDTFGFQHMAFVFSLPKVLGLWSLLLFISHWIFIAAAVVNTNTAIGSVALFLVLVLGLWRGISSGPDDSTCSPRPKCYWGRLFSRFSSDEDTQETSPV